MPFNPKAFQKSINQELILLKDRVKNLIEIDGINHHGEDGNYRELVLRNIIRRFLPNNLSIGTGFVISNDEEGAKRSTQIDILIYDNSYPLLFQEGDFIITTPRSVKAIIEVKTTIVNTELNDILEKSKDNYNLITKNNGEIFNGVFSYNYEDDNIIDGRNGQLASTIKNSLEYTNGKVNHISLGQNIFIRYWDKSFIDTLVREEDQRIIARDCSNSFFNIYELRDLSFAYFISNLIYWISDKNIDEQGWFLFPIDSANGKEDYFIEQCCLEDSDS